MTLKHRVKSYKKIRAEALTLACEDCEGSVVCNKQRTVLLQCVQASDIVLIELCQAPELHWVCWIAWSNMDILLLRRHWSECINGNWILFLWHLILALTTWDHKGHVFSVSQQVSRLSQYSPVEDMSPCLFGFVSRVVSLHQGLYLFIRYMNRCFELTCATQRSNP